MPRHQYVILSQASAGQEAEFDTWYDGQHLHDVCKVDGVVSAKRFKIDSQMVTDLDAPKWYSLAIYEIESDDPQAVVAAISSVAGSEAMPLSEALSKNGMIQIVAHEVAAVA